MPTPVLQIDPLDCVRRPGLALALLVPAPTIGVVMNLWVAPGPVGGATYALAKVWLLLVPLLWAMAVDHRPPLGCVRTGGRDARRGLGIGAALGIVISLGIIGVFEAVQRVTGGIDAATLRSVAAGAGFGSVRSYLLVGVYLALVNSLLEEYVWRWFTFRATASLMPASLAVPVSALLFTLHHVLVLAAYFPAWLTLLGSLGVFIGGCAWSWCYLRYQSIWPGYVSHAIVDVAILWIGWRLLFD